MQQQDHERTDPRTRILAAAGEIFAEVGYGGARVDAIARRAGVNKAMLYYHVGDKATLYHTVLTRNFDIILSSLAERVEGAHSPEDRLRAFIEGLTSAAGHIAHHPQIMLREIASGGVNLDQQIVQRIFESMKLLFEILEDGVDAGQFNPSNPLMTHFTIVGAVVFMTSVAPVVARFKDAAPTELGGPTLWNQEELAEHLFTLLTKGLTVRGDQP